MIVTALITCHSRDLALICLRSLVRHAPTIQRVSISTHPSCLSLPPDLSNIVGNPSFCHLSLPDPPGGAANHAAALEYARTRWNGLPPSISNRTDVILCLDDDVVILSDQFLSTLELAFAGPIVGAWGARGIRDPLHASCLAMRRELFEKVTTFASALPARDTTGLAQGELFNWGYRLYSEPATRLHPEGWDAFGTDLVALGFLWAHLGGGVIHAPVSPLRRAVRQVRAAFGHEPSRDLILKATMRERWITIYG